MSSRVKGGSIVGTGGGGRGDDKHGPLLGRLNFYPQGLPRFGEEYRQWLIKRFGESRCSLAEIQISMSDILERE
jgi:hypothetical protein